MYRALQKCVIFLKIVNCKEHESQSFVNNYDSLKLKGECSLSLKKVILWMKTIHYPNTIRSLLVTIVPMALFTPKSTSNLRYALHIRYSIGIRHFISHANTAQFYDYNHYVYSDYLVCSVPAIAHIIRY